jgi:hypothetical protein
VDYYGEIDNTNGYLTKKLSISQTSQIFKFIFEYSPERNKHREKIIEFSGKYQIKDNLFIFYVDYKSEDFIMDWIDEEPVYEAVIDNYEKLIIIKYSIKFFDTDHIQLKLKEEEENPVETLDFLKEIGYNDLGTLTLYRLVPQT